MANVIIIGRGEATMGFSWIKGHKAFVTLENDPTGDLMKKFALEDELDYEAMDKRLDRADATICFDTEGAIDLMIEKLQDLKEKMVWEGGHPKEEYDETVQTVLNKLDGGK